MRIGLAQINPIVGDTAGNAQKISVYISEAKSNQCDLVVFPEMALPGYPPEDLILKPAFVDANIKELRRIARTIKDVAVIIGFIDRRNKDLFNAAAWIENGHILDVYHKQQLPNYGVFDERRYFSPGHRFRIRTLRGCRVGLTICEDIWIGSSSLKNLKTLKPDATVNLSASPFHVDKMPLRYKAACQSAAYLKTPLFYCNMVGGQDELVFDGGGFCAMPNGKIIGQSKRFHEGMVYFDMQKSARTTVVALSESSGNKADSVSEIFHALILGLRDYVDKNGFEKVALGISGGIDSALVAALAVAALGAERVIGVTMPSRYNSKETLSDSHALAANLGIRLLEIPIQTAYEKMLEMLSPVFTGQATDTTEENLQARIRGNILMSLSNKFGWLILTTGNKSETSTGYCTLYGDTAGGFAVIKDVLKTTVYALAGFVNKQAGKNLIPQSTIDRAPSAELRDGQRDEDSLGSYAELDPLITGYVEKNASLSELVKSYPKNPDYVRKIIRSIDRNEYKRRQAPPGIKITARSFGRDHRMPITNRFVQNF